MSESDRMAPALLHALHAAADKHRDQRRKDPTASPWVDHPPSPSPSGWSWRRAR